MHEIFFILFSRMRDNGLRFLVNHKVTPFLLFLLHNVWFVQSEILVSHKGVVVWNFIMYLLMVKDKVIRIYYTTFFIEYFNTYAYNICNSR